MHFFVKELCRAFHSFASIVVRNMRGRRQTCVVDRRIRVTWLCFS